MDRIHARLKQVQTAWLQRQRARLALRSTVIGFATTVLMRAIAYIGWGHFPFWVALLSFIAGGFAYAALRKSAPLSTLAAARFVDHTLDLHDRTATAIEWQSDPSPLIRALIADADAHLHDADVAEVVPRFTLRQPKTRPWTGAAVLLVCLLLLPFPSGLMVRPHEAPPAVPSPTDDMITEIQDLMEEIRSARRSDLERINRDLTTLHAALQDRALPQNEAAALLDHIKRRLDATWQDIALDRQDETIHLDLASLERLADNERAVDESPTAENGDAQIPYGTSPERAEDPADATGDHADDPMDTPPDLGRDDAFAHVNGAANTADDPSPDDAAERSFGDELGEGRPDDQDESTDDQLPESGPSDADFERLAATRILEHAAGASQSGPVYVGAIPTVFSSGGGLATSLDDEVTFDPAVTQSQLDPGLLREDIPLAYRDTIQSYFALLESGL